MSTPEEEIPQIELNPAALHEKIQEHLELRFYAKNPWNRGYLCGLIDAWNTITGESVEPPVLEGVYADTWAATTDIAVHAIRLLGECPVINSDPVDYTKWRQRVIDLIQTWQMNTESSALKMALDSAEVRYEKDPVVLIIGDETYIIKKASDLYDIREVSDACSDAPGWQFESLMVEEMKWMCAHHISVGKDPMVHRLTRIGQIDRHPLWLRVPKAPSPKPCTQ